VSGPTRGAAHDATAAHHAVNRSRPRMKRLVRHTANNAKPLERFRVVCFVGALGDSSVARV
jgi:hypothetical protein